MLIASFFISKIRYNINESTKRGKNMSFGINGSDPFVSYSSDKNAGGGMGVYVHRDKNGSQKKDEQKKEEDLLNLSDEQDESNLEIDTEDIDDFLS